MEFETVTSKMMYQGRAFNVRRDQVRAPNGQVLDLDIVDHSGAVTILPIDEQGQVWFVQQYRHPTGKLLLELPAGTLKPGEAPELCAQREVREEIGMAAGKLAKLGEFFLAPGYSTEYMHVYLATELYPAPLPGDEDEFLSIVRVPASQLNTLVASGEIQDGKSIAALYLAKLPG